MKLWKRFVLGSMSLALALSLYGAADAATKKKKAAKKPAQATSVAAEETKSTGVEYLSGTNLWGRAGLFIADTSEGAELNRFEGAANFTYQSLKTVSVPPYNITTDRIGVPFGFHYGLTENVDLYASGDFRSLRVDSDIPSFPGTTVNTFVLTGGGKYHIVSNTPRLSFGVGGDVSVPTTGGSVVFTPKGTATYTLENGILFNGEVGAALSTSSYVLADFGVGLPIVHNITAIAEVGANQFGDGDSVLALGLRGRISTVNVQGFVGIPLENGGAMIGGGISLASR